jgi:hypothetical protein
MSAHEQLSKVIFDEDKVLINTFDMMTGDVSTNTISFPSCSKTTSLQGCQFGQL